MQAAILNGDEYTGVTIMKMDAGIDTGPILMQEKVFLDQEENLSTLHDKLANLGADLLLCALEAYIPGKLLPTNQPAEGATYAPMLSKQDGLLDFSQSILTIDRKVRALNDWPGAFYSFNSQPLKIRKVRVIPSENHPSGIRSILEKHPMISTPDGWVQLLEVQPAGKKWMTGADFLRGTSNWSSGQ